MFKFGFNCLIKRLSLILRNDLLDSEPIIEKLLKLELHLQLDIGSFTVVSIPFTGLLVKQDILKCSPI